MPDPIASSSSHQVPKARRRHRRRVKPSMGKQLARHTKFFELGARLGINTLLTLIALMALGRLVPHLQNQVDQLALVSQALDRAQASNTKLQSDFGRYFDPWQTESIIQEQSGYRPPSERQVVWTEDEAHSAESSPSVEGRPSKPQSSGEHSPAGGAGDASHQELAD